MASTPEGRREIARVAEHVLPALIARLSASELGELEVRDGDWRVRLRRDQATVTAPATGATAPGERATGGGRGMAGERSGSSERGVGTDRGDRGAASRSAASRRVITSPAVGYFTLRAALAVGQAIRAGDVVGHVDVLGVPVDVVAPADGRVGRLYAAAGEAVEYGQELVRFDGVEAGITGVGPGADGTHAINLDSPDAATDVGIETAPAVLVE